MTRRLSAILALDVAGYSEAMARDPDGTLADLRRVFADVVRPQIRQHDGRIVKLLGDGALAEFRTPSEGIRAAAAILAALREDPVRLRAGLHVGEISIQEGDVFGDAVNIAARLQAEAETGGGLVTRTAAELAGGGLRVVLRPESARALKGVDRPVEVLAIDVDAEEAAIRHAALGRSQDIRFAASRDGTRLAWTAVGEGPPLFKAPNWIQHLELDWETVNAGWMGDLARFRRLVRFDQRGNGLSDRGVDAITLDLCVGDTEAVFKASGLRRAPIIALSQGAPISIAFAHRHPEFVSGLIFIGGYARGALLREEEQHAERIAAMDAMAKVGWDEDYPSIRDLFARVLMPDAREPDLRTFAEHMRGSITKQDFSVFREAVGYFDVSELLGEIRCPALILHGREDRLQPLEEGRRLAAGLQNAKLVALSTRNHVMPPYDPAWPVALREIRSFLDGLEA